MRYAIFLLIFVVTLGLYTPAHAQLSDLTQSSVEVSLIPENPKAGETVQASIVSYLTDLDSASVVWQVNGKIIKSGIGVKMVNVTVGNIGDTTNITILIKTKEGDSITKTVSLTPASVDLMWQSDGYTPPFYRGKTMFGHQNTITFIAIPHMSSAGEVNPQSYIYKWTQNGKALQDSSGYGKNTLTVTGSIISRPLKIEVEVSTPSSYATAYGYINVTPTDPFVLLYNKSPLYGIEFQKAIQGYVNMTEPEITVVATPMFFGIKNLTSPEISYAWSINGSSINNSLRDYMQVFRPKEGTSGTSNITVKVEHLDKILQFSSRSFNLSFGNQQQ